MAGPGGASGPLLLSASGRPAAAGHVSGAAAAVLRVYVSHAALDTLSVCERSAADIAFVAFVWVKLAKAVKYLHCKKVYIFSRH